MLKPNHISLPHALTAILLAVIASCAQIVAPTGGPKDSTPPRVIKENPANKQTLLKDKKIVVSFDEFVTLSNPNDQIVISPPLDEKPEFEVSGKSVVVTFTSKPKDNVTYTINFGNAIVDAHEGNILSDYRYVFSTGLFVDTLMISGIVINAENNVGVKNISVCLYKDSLFNDSTIYLSKPAYFSKTKENGYFTLQNLPPGRFRLVGFSDENKNLLYDKNEAICFNSKPIQTTDTTNMFRLGLYNPDLYKRGHIIDTFSREQHKYTFLVYKPSTAVVTPVNAKTHYLWKKQGKSETDSLFVFTGMNDPDSLLFSYNNTTFPIKTKKNAPKPKIIMDLNKNVELNDSVSLSFTTPLSLINTAGIQLLEDTIPVKYNITPDALKRTVKVHYPWKENTKYEIHFNDSCFTDIYGQFNKKDKFIWSSKNLKSYSSLKLNFTYTDSLENVLVLITSVDEKQLFKSFYINKQKEWFFDYIMPATYKIKLIHDVNRNGIWDNGDFMAQKQPESVFYVPENITLRAYWDLEQSIDVNSIIK